MACSQSRKRGLLCGKIIFQIYFESAEGNYLKAQSWQSISGKSLHCLSLKCEKNALQQGLWALWVNRKAKYTCIWGIMAGFPFTEDGMWSGGNSDLQTLSVQFHTTLPTGHEQRCNTARAAAKWETMGGGGGIDKWICLIRTHTYIYIYIYIYLTFCLYYKVASCWIRLCANLCLSNTLKGRKLKKIETRTEKHTWITGRNK
jgi:hypothetical protein